MVAVKVELRFGIPVWFKVEAVVRGGRIGAGVGF
jgi:hypothetical protein